MVCPWFHLLLHSLSSALAQTQSSELTIHKHKKNVCIDDGECSFPHEDATSIDPALPGAEKKPKKGKGDEHDVPRNNDYERPPTSIYEPINLVFTGKEEKEEGSSPSMCLTRIRKRGVNSHPPGGFLSFIKNTLSNGNSPQQINIDDDDDDTDCTRTEKRLLWKKEEDLRLVGAWLNNSNDPIGSNNKKNDQYWKDVAAVYNSTTPKSQVRPVKQVKTRFAKIKKKVQWFCASWKEANTLYASGESDIDLMERVIKTYKADHKTDGPFMFKHCWDVLRKEPKWDAYLECLQELEPNKRNFSTYEDVGQHFSLDATAHERPIGGKQAKEQLKRKRKDQACIIDLEGELNKFVDAQNAATEGRKEMLEIQKRVSSENLEARKLALLAAKEQKEATMLETYGSLIVQDTTVMSEDVRSEHVLALRCLREKLFSNND
ncbi:hypothetical protein BS78_01G250200 [Paspalum vaginatum]|nr:hypothetical protein BS78_01G250200 [Paspalum vaginatum]